MRITMEYYLKCWKQYVDFESRARRSEYWNFVLFNAIIYAVIMCVTVIGFMAGGYVIAIIGNIMNWVYSVAIFLPSLAVSVRRLHDVGKSGWNLLWGVIPIFGSLYLLVLSCQDSKPGSNKWGVNPKQ